MLHTKRFINTSIHTCIHTYILHARRINIDSANARSTVRNAPSAHIQKVIKLRTVKNVKADQLILIKIIRVLVVATKQWRVQQAVLTVQPYRLRHILAFAIKETLRKWKWTAKPTSFGGLASIKWLDVIHVQKHNLWTDRFGWACYINDCDVVKQLLHEISSRIMATSTLR